MSILKTIPITLDLKRVGAQSQALPTLVEGDNGNVFVITMTDDGESLSLANASKVICVFSKTSDGRTVEQDTEDANIQIEDYGITVEGTPATNDTITVTSESGAVSAEVAGIGITGATVDADTFLEKFEDDGTYSFLYNGSSWQYGEHSVVIGGDNSNIITVHLKSASFGAGTNNCEVQIYSGTDGGTLVTTANFNFRGRKGIMNDETLLSEEKYPILVSLIARVTAALKAAAPFGNPSASANTLAAGSSATAGVTLGDESVEFVFGIPRGDGITSIALISGDHTPGTFDTYRITRESGAVTDFQIWNGADGVKIASDDDPQALGTADPGTEDTYSRSDHVHPMPSNVDVGVGYKIFYHVTEIGLSTGAALSDVWNAMPDRSIALINWNIIAESDRPVNYGMFEILRNTSGTGYIYYHGNTTGQGDWRMHIVNYAPSGTWKRVHDCDDILYFSSIACSAKTGDFVSYSNSAITANHVVAECVFANPAYITSDVTWTTAAGSLKLNGTCSTATTCNVVLVKKDN